VQSTATFLDYEQTAYSSSNCSSVFFLLQKHSDHPHLHSFPTRRSSDLCSRSRPVPGRATRCRLRAWWVSLPGTGSPVDGGDSASVEAPPSGIGTAAFLVRL